MTKRKININVVIDWDDYDDVHDEIILDDCGIYESLKNGVSIELVHDKNNTVLTNEPCPNCKETVKQCACMRNLCQKCKNPVGNITFTICDDCWDAEFRKK